MVKIIGIFLHFSYWILFGQVNPVQLDGLAKKQMYISLNEIFDSFSEKEQNKKTKYGLHMPMLLLTLKMLVEYIFRVKLYNIWLKIQIYFFLF